MVRLSALGEDRIALKLYHLYQHREGCPPACHAERGDYWYNCWLFIESNKDSWNELYSDLKPEEKTAVDNPHPSPQNQRYEGDGVSDVTG